MILMEGDTAVSGIYAAAKLTEEEKDAILADLAECTHDDGCALSAFDDLDAAEWYHDGIHFCIDRGYMIGVSDSEFNPVGVVTRAEVAMILWRYAGTPYVNYFMPFEDVEAEAWYTEAVRWVAAEKLMTGTDETHFAPGETITREELAIVLYAYACKLDEGFRGASMFAMPYADLDQVSAEGFNPMRWCIMKHVIIGKDSEEGTLLDPKGILTRAELAEMIERFVLVF